MITRSDASSDYNFVSKHFSDEKLIVGRDSKSDVSLGRSGVSLWCSRKQATVTTR